MKVSLEGGIVLVTGAASGIGRAAAELAAEAGAAGLVLTDQDADGLAEVAARLPAEVVTVVADLGASGAPARVAQQALRRFGRIDGLVNAAARTSLASLADATEAGWDAMFAVNARAPFFLMQAAIGDMVRRGAAGSVVNILSVNAHCGAPDLAVYSTSKGALLNATKNAAHAHLAARIRVNGILLGWTLTPSEDRLQTEELGQGEDWAELVGAARPLGRLLEPAEIARHIVWLLSEASAPMTGVAFDLEQRVIGGPG